MNELVVYETYDHLCFAGHSRVYGVVAETFAVDGIVRRRNGRSDLITRIDVFQIDMEVLVFKILRNFVAEIYADIRKFDIARRIRFVRFREQFLPCAFGNDNDGVVTFF